MEKEMDKFLPKTWEIDLKKSFRLFFEKNDKELLQ